MQNRKLRTLLLLSFILTIGFQKSGAQELDALGSFTPYSLYGIGDLQPTGTTVNRAMGGIGAGLRDNRFVNYKNVASITERDTLSFMLDIGLYSNNIYIKDGGNHTANNTVNINDLVMSFPIKNKTAILLGITPFSNIGYKFESKEEDEVLIAKYGDIAYQKYGDGSTSQTFLGIATNLTKNLAIGAEGIYYFGELKNHSNVLFNSDASVRTSETGWGFKATGFSAEFGAQYSAHIAEDYTLTLGATYRLQSKLTGDLLRYAYVYDASIADTVAQEKNSYRLTIPAKITGGVSLRKTDKWVVGFDYEYQDWSKANFRPTPGVGFTAQATTAYRFGIEYIPNRYDIRYFYKRMSYRLGCYYNETYVNLNGIGVKQMGITAGVSVPVFRWNNSINIAVDIGQRGSTKGILVRERYCNFIVSLNLYDIWFVKQRYE